jgi:fluoride exporter
VIQDDTMMLEWLGLAAGCALGGMARVFVSRLVGERGLQMPWNTLVVNASGALLIGLLAGGLSGSATSAASPLGLALGIGFLGSYTTVSTFSLQTLALLQAGHRRAALGNIALSLALCLPAAGVGMAVAQLLSAQ